MLFRAGTCRWPAATGDGYARACVGEFRTNAHLVGERFVLKKRTWLITGCHCWGWKLGKEAMGTVRGMLDRVSGASQVLFRQMLV